MTGRVIIDSYSNGLLIKIVGAGSYFCGMGDVQTIHLEDLRDSKLLCITHHGLTARYLVASRIEKYLKDRLRFSGESKPYTGGDYFTAEEHCRLPEACVSDVRSVSDISAEEFESLCRGERYSVQPTPVMRVSYIIGSSMLDLDLDIDKTLVVSVKDITLCKEVVKYDKHILVLKYDGVMYQVTSDIGMAPLSLIGVIYCKGKCVRDDVEIDGYPRFSNTLIGIYSN